MGKWIVIVTAGVVVFLLGVVAINAIALSPAFPQEGERGPCVWGDYRCFRGDISKLSCGYAHPSAFSDADWIAFRQRCRESQG